MRRIERAARRTVLTRSAIATVAVLLMQAAGALAQPYVYVANLGSDEISVLDAATNSVATTLPAGDDPNGVAVSPDGTRVYVTNFFSGTLTILDATANAIVATVPVGENPVGVAVSTDGTAVYVANRAANEVAVFDPIARTVRSRIPVGAGPNAVAVTPDGHTAYVTNSFTGFPGQVSVLDLATNAVRDIVEVARGPNRVAVSPDGRRVYVTNFRSWNLSVIDAATAAVVDTLRVGDKPTSVAVNPNGAYAYVTLQHPDDGNVQIIETATNRVTASLLAGYDPRAIAADRRGGLGYVANFWSDTVTVLDLGNQAVLDDIEVGERPFALGVNCVGSGCDAPPFTPHSTKTVTLTPTIPTPTATPTITVTATTTKTATRTATLRPGLEHVVIEVGGAQGSPGGRLPIEVSLHTGGQVVHGVAHDIEFTEFVRVVERAPGVPACALDASTDATARFEFIPADCDFNCAGVHVAIAASAPLRDNTLLYRCAVEIASWAQIGSQRLRTTGVGASGRRGEVLATRGRDGVIAVVRGPTPTPQPTRPPEVFLQLESVSARPGERASLTVRLDARGRSIAGTQNDILFGDVLSVVARADSDPDCTVNPAIHKSGSAFAFQPPGCSADSCTAIRALVLSLENVEPIPDGSVLYTCRLAIAADAAPGTYPLEVTGVGASDPDGNEIPAAARSAVFTVLGNSARLQAGFAPDLTRVCSGGARAAQLCVDHADCPAGSCHAVHGICDGGEDDGLLCDCPGGACSGQSPCSADSQRGTCAGGVLDGQCCDRAFNCGGGAACLRTDQLCVNGPSKGSPCLDGRHCAGAACVGTSRACIGGPYDGASCIDDSGCPLGTCGGGGTRPNGEPPTPTVTPRLTPGPQGSECAFDRECLSGFCTDGICCEMPCPPDQFCATGSGMCTTYPPTPTATRITHFPTADPCGSCPRNMRCESGPPPMCVILTSDGGGGGCSTSVQAPAAGNLAIVAALPLALWLGRRLQGRKVRLPNCN